MLGILCFGLKNGLISFQKYLINKLDKLSNIWDTNIMKTKNTQGVLVQEFTNTKVACTCGRGNTHFHRSGKGVIITPLA